MTDPPSPLWDSIPPNPVGQALSSALKPTKNAGLWVVALASVVVVAALVVIALMSVQTRDAEREQACYARAAAANEVLEWGLSESRWEYWVTPWRECEERFQD
jgi:hypothetical protein